MTHGETLFPWNLAPRQSSTFPVESLLLPPRSALRALPPALTDAALPETRTPSYTLRNQPASMAPVRLAASASSIFKTGNLGECVSGRSLAGADFHGHSLSVKSRQASLRCLGERRIRRRTGCVRFIPHRQSSLPGRPTYRDHSDRFERAQVPVWQQLRVVSIYSLRISAGHGAPRAASQWLYRVQLVRIGVLAH